MTRTSANPLQRALEVPDDLEWIASDRPRRLTDLGTRNRTHTSDSAAISVQAWQEQR